MSDEIRFALRRSALIYGCVAGGAVTAGIAWGLLGHHDVGYCIGVFHYIAAALIVVGATFSQSRPRKEYVLLTIEERRRSFSTHMWLLAIAAALVVTGVVLQLLL